MGDSEDALPPLSKKRAAGREISKDDPGLDDEEDFGEQETGTFKRASDEVLATRRIVKVRRSTTTTSSNPFAGIRLVAPSVSTPAPVQVPGEEAATSEKATEDVKNDVGEESGRGKEENCGKSENKIDESASDSAVEIESAVDKENVEKLEDKSGNEKVEGEEAGSEDKKEGCQADNEDKKGNGDENVNASSEGAPLSSFQQLSSSKNAFTGLAGTGLSTSAFSFGSISKDGSSDPSSGPLFGQRSDQLSFGFGRSANGSSSLFGTSGSSIASKSEGSGFVTLQDVPAETGEENERVAFSADSMLFEFIDGGWKERGKGEVKVNVSTSGTERARLLMRARGNFRLILNASLYPDMKLTNMDKKGITFACINSISEGKDGLSTFALKFKDIALVDEFRRVVTEHKGKAGTALKTPENSPKASDK